MLDLGGMQVQSGQSLEHFAAAGEAGLGGHAADHASGPGDTERRSKPSAASRGC